MNTISDVRTQTPRRVTRRVIALSLALPATISLTACSTGPQRPATLAAATVTGAVQPQAAVPTGPVAAPSPGGPTAPVPPSQGVDPLAARGGAVAPQSRLQGPGWSLVARSSAGSPGLLCLDLVRDAVLEYKADGTQVIAPAQSFCAKDDPALATSLVTFLDSGTTHLVLGTAPQDTTSVTLGSASSKVTAALSGAFGSHRLYAAVTATRPVVISAGETVGTTLDLTAHVLKTCGAGDIDSASVTLPCGS